jgi:hypothetical protein
MFATNEPKEPKGVKEPTVAVILFCFLYFVDNWVSYHATRSSSHTVKVSSDKTLV